ncbi:CCAAT- binding transcription factor component [Mycoemilia scoparia]|uniref:CCAAT- binding transcription factor component n=1 Tax=Mycoemilia scoparia TaxID=417184 RepID=A0A9W8A813_9FUNG|nr:CCAAT- binding transcription factor component [Mycoemilia scoparia]
MSNLNHSALYGGEPDSSYGIGNPGGGGYPGDGAARSLGLSGGAQQSITPSEQPQVSGLVRNQALGKQVKTIQDFWKAQVEEIQSGTHDFKLHQLPLARIKKVMKTDEDVKMISAEAPVIFSKACEIMILELTLRAWLHAEENKRRTLQRSDISHAVSKSDMFDFLIDIVPREESVKSSTSMNLDYYAGVHPGIPRMVGNGQYMFQGPGGSALPLMDQLSHGFLRSANIPTTRSTQDGISPTNYTLSSNAYQLPTSGGGAGSSVQVSQPGYYSSASSNVNTPTLAGGYTMQGGSGVDGSGTAPGGGGGY